MTQEEITVRSMYLFLACSQAIEQFAARLAATIPAPDPSLKPALDRSLKRELGLLFRYWVSQQIWERLDASEADAKNLNLALLRLFTEAFKLPRDGSGLRYAALSSMREEIQELSRRITDALGTADKALVMELEGAILPWRDAITKYTSDALETPLEPLSASVKALVERRIESTET